VTHDIDRAMQRALLEDRFRPTTPTAMTPVLVICWFALLGALLFGCQSETSKRQANAQVALTAGGVALVEIDERVSARIVIAARAAAEVAETIEIWDEMMAPWVTTNLALETAADALRAMQRALDAWRAGAGDEGDWRSAVACAVPIVRELEHQLRVHDVEVPASIGVFVNLVAGYGEANCPEPEGAQ